MEIHNDENIIDIPNEELTVRHAKANKRVILADGTIKTITFNRTYKVKTDRRAMGKAKLIERIRACKDAEKINRINILLDELEL
jgi:hypothetical protein